MNSLSTRKIIALALCAAGALSLRMLWVFPWLEGRSNGRFAGLMLAMESFALLVWIACVCTIMGMMLNEWCKKARSHSLGRVLALLISFVPWAFRVSPYTVEDAVLRGFVGWVAYNVRTEELQGALMNVGADVNDVADTPWWLITPGEPMPGREFPQEQWPEAVAIACPDAVRILDKQADRGILFLWRSTGLYGTPRYVYMGPPGVEVPIQFRNHLTVWQRVNDKTWAGVRVMH